MNELDDTDSHPGSLTDFMLFTWSSNLYLLNPLFSERFLEIWILKNLCNSDENFTLLTSWKICETSSIWECRLESPSGKLLWDLFVLWDQMHEEILLHERQFHYEASLTLACKGEIQNIGILESNHPKWNLNSDKHFPFYLHRHPLGWLDLHQDLKHHHFLFLHR